MASENFLIFGATGVVGTQVVLRLLEEKNAGKIFVFVRDEAKAKAAFGDGVTTIAGDISKVADINNAFKKVANPRVFLLTNGAQATVEPPVAKAAAENKAKLIVKLSAVNANFNEGRDGLLREQAEAEKAVQEAAGAVPVVILRPTFFHQNSLRDEAPSIKGQNKFYLDLFPETRVTRIDVRDIAESVATLFTQDATKYAGRTFTLTAGAFTAAEYAAQYSAVLGRDIQVVLIDDVAFYQTLQQYGIPEGYAWKFVKLYQALKAGPILPYGDYEILTGKKPRSFQQFVTDFKDKF